MAARVEIDLATEAEAQDLLWALGSRGLSGRVTSLDGRLGLVLEYAHESTQRLLTDLLPALEVWRHDRARGPLTLRAGGRVYRLASATGSPRRPSEAAPTRRVAARAA
jgi:hypothetical protein